MLEVEDLNYLLKKWIENPKSDSSRKQYLMLLKSLKLAPKDYEDENPDGAEPTHKAPQGQDTKLQRRIPGIVIPGTLEVQVNNFRQTPGVDFSVDCKTGEVTWLKTATIDLDEEDWVFYRCKISPV